MKVAQNFDTIVAARAAERVNQKIGIFRKAVSDALYGLDPSQWRNSYGADSYRAHCGSSAMQELLQAIGGQTDWPARLWEAEAKKVREELLATMDEMTKALIAAEKYVPVETPKVSAEEKVTI